MSEKESSQSRTAGNPCQFGMKESRNEFGVVTWTNEFLENFHLCALAKVVAVHEATRHVYTHPIESLQNASEALARAYIDSRYPVVTVDRDTNIPPAATPSATDVKKRDR